MNQWGNFSCDNPILNIFLKPLIIRDKLNYTHVSNMIFIISFHIIQWRCDYMDKWDKIYHLIIFEAGEWM